MTCVVSTVVLPNLAIVSQCKCYCRSLQCFLHLHFLTCFEDTEYIWIPLGLGRELLELRYTGLILWCSSPQKHDWIFQMYGMLLHPVVVQQPIKRATDPCRSRVGDSSAAVFNFSHDEVKPWKVPLGSKTHHFWRVWFTEFLKTWRNIGNIHICICIYMIPSSAREVPPLPPRMGWVPGSTPTYLLFASYWQHFWSPASYLPGFCSDSDYQPPIY